MKHIYKTAALAALFLSVFALPSAAQSNAAYSKYIADLRKVAIGCETTPKATRKTHCLNAISLIRLSRKTFRYDIPEQDIIFDSLETLATLHLAHIYLVEGNIKLFCDYSHTGGLLLRDTLRQTDALIASDPETYKSMVANRKRLDPLTDLANRNKLVCLNERITISKR